jgi:hypothetical protein
LDSVCERPSADIERAFVRHRSPHPSPARIQHYRATSQQVRLSVIIPTLDGHRNGCLAELLGQIGDQNGSEFEVIVIQGDPRQGRAINIGAALAAGDYLLTLDDDTSLPDPDTFAKLMAVMDLHPDIGMAGGNNLIPKDASPFVRRVMRELPRRSWPPVADITDSDLAEHPCLMMRTAEFKAVGGENELIPRGLDPYLRMEYRQIHKRIVVVPGVVYHHLPPARLMRLLRQFLRNGRQAAYTSRHFPGWVIETPSGHGPVRSRVSSGVRICRFPLRLAKALVVLKPIWLMCEFAYAAGFLHEWMALRRSPTGRRRGCPKGLSPATSSGGRSA